jgi:hypothetical protein
MSMLLSRLAKPASNSRRRGGGRRFFGATELAQALVRDLDETAAWRRRYGALFVRDAERRSLSSDRSHWPLCTGGLLPHLTR